MNKRYIRNGLEYYMEVETMGGEAYEYQMLQENQIAFLLPLQRTQIDQREYLSYSTAGVKPYWITMHKLWITGEQFRCLVDSLLKALEEIKRYFLTADNLVLETECLFVDLEKFQFQFLYVPGYQKDIFRQLEGLVENLLARMDYKDQEGMMLAYGLSRLLKEETTDMEEICLYLHQSSLPGNRIEQEKEKSRTAAFFAEKNDGLSERVKLQTTREPLEPNHILMEENIQTSKKKRKEEKKKKGGWKQILCWIVWTLLLLGIVGMVFLIYWDGILAWKRNVLIVLGILFFLDSVLVVLFSRKNKQEEEAASIFQFPEEEQEPWAAPELSKNPGIKTWDEMEQETYEEKREETWKDPVPWEEPKGGTMILTDDAAIGEIPRFILIGGEKPETILLVHFPFTIGSYPNGVDYRIEKRQISRFHAVIKKEGDKFWIKDLQSTNGTFVNDSRLEGEKEHEIYPGDRIRFADRSYRFVIREQENLL